MIVIKQFDDGVKLVRQNDYSTMLIGELTQDVWWYYEQLLLPLNAN